MRLLAWLAYAALIVVGHLAALPIMLWRAVFEGVDGRVYRAALLWDLMLAELLGAPEGQTVSTWMAHKRPGLMPCLFCRLLSVRWPTHCDDAAGVEFEVRRK